YLLYLDPASRFSVVSFVWGPGQGTPVHDHTTWGAVGVLRGAERSQVFVEHGQDEWQPRGDAVIHWPGMVETVSPEIGDVHQVSNAVDRVSISIHVYGGDIGTTSRHSFPADGGVRSFVSGYVSDPAAPPFSLSS
ncbi:MAG TPA: cysteine dioxygenase, partial [Sphingomicrobium sp.]